MNNNQDNHELQQATTVATPPPFCPSEEPEVQPQEQAASPTLTERIAAMGLDEEKTRRLTQLTAGLPDTAATDEVLTTLAQGIAHDEDVKNADAAGFLRGRNEKIETVMHQHPDHDVEPQSTPVFPRYCRRSVWD